MNTFDYTRTNAIPTIERTRNCPVRQIVTRETLMVYYTIHYHAGCIINVTAICYGSHNFAARFFCWVAVSANSNLFTAPLALTASTELECYQRFIYLSRRGAVQQTKKRLFTSTAQQNANRTYPRGFVPSPSGAYFCWCFKCDHNLRFSKNSHIQWRLSFIAAIGIEKVFSLLDHCFHRTPNLRTPIASSWVWLNLI